MAVFYNALLYVAPLYAVSCWPLAIFVYKNKIASCPLMTRVIFDLLFVSSFLIALLLSFFVYMSLTDPKW